MAAADMAGQALSAQANYISVQTQQLQDVPSPEPIRPGQSSPLRVAPARRPTAEETRTLYNLNLAHQVMHNLQYQHDWTDLAVHTHSPIRLPGSLPTPVSPSPASLPLLLLPKPLVTGVPPKPIYVHPDTQLALIRQNVREEDCMPEHTVVLPTRLAERVTLRSLAAVFDALPEVQGLKLPSSTTRLRNPGRPGQDTDEDVDPASPLAPVSSTSSSAYSSASPSSLHPPARGSVDSRDRTLLKNGDVKRLLLATVDDDSSVTYYVVHDGIVKPRQN